LVAVFYLGCLVTRAHQARCSTGSRAGAGAAFLGSAVGFMAAL